MFWAWFGLAFVIGVFVGAAIGFIAGAILTRGKMADEISSRNFRG